MLALEASVNQCEVVSFLFVMTKLNILNMEAHDCGPKYLSKEVESMTTQRHTPRCLFQFCSLYSFLAPNKSNALVQ